MGKLVGRAAAAEALGVVPGRINRMVAAGAPVAVKGHRGQPAQYSIADLVAWRSAREALRRVDGEELSLERERALLARAQREKTEMANAMLRGELLKRDLVITQGRAYTVGWTGQVRSIARRARQSGIIATPAAEAALADLCRQILMDISLWRTPADALKAAAA